MSRALVPVETLSEAWLTALEAAAEPQSGRLVHLISTVTCPGSEIPSIRQVADEFAKRQNCQPIDEVAETIFPLPFVSQPARRWSPDLSEEQEREVLLREQRLYAMFDESLDVLLTANGNRSGTYFSRMATWPGKQPGGVNQIAERITALRKQVRHGRSAYNAMDIDVAADAVTDLSDEEPLRGLEVYSATDRRNRGFPCLTHIDLTLFEGRLNMTGVYRHQFLVRKAYGNLLGLSWLLQFIAVQGGVDVGELVVHATLADSEVGELGRTCITELIGEVRSAYESSNA